MKERPILFSAPMVRAILDGSKTQTRRIVKNPDRAIAGCDVSGLLDQPKVLSEYCPYGKPGDRLWVRETTGIDDVTSDRVILANYLADGAPVLYSSCDDLEYNGSAAHWWYSRDICPSIHMPRWASRITLEIVGVRVERLNDISEADAKAEGILQVKSDGYQNYDGTGGYWGSAINSFETLWESISGAGSWTTNPWVWVIEFKPISN